MVGVFAVGYFLAMFAQLFAVFYLSLGLLTVGIFWNLLLPGLLAMLIALRLVTFEPSMCSKT
jgi:hypothetical protein